ncbi:MAG: hypothetical protein IBJ12_00270 [Sphingomonadaceae bacterium]|nr:hypothetical protein [Sphingomonadaceae bacterium]
MQKLAKIAVAVLGIIVAGSVDAAPFADSAADKTEIRTDPIAGIYNKAWYAYLADVREAEQELGSDLRRATDAEDRRDAWEEYHNELVDADKDYVKEMRERGYRAGRVTVG